MYVYSARRCAQRYRELDAAFGDYPHAIHYAFKANSTLRARRELLRAGSAVDAESMWEVEWRARPDLRRRRSCSPAWASPTRSSNAPCRSGSRRSTSSRQASWRASSRLRARLGHVARVAIRVNPDIDAKSHPHISTGLKINKFGIPTDEARACCRRSARRVLQLVALHVHVGSQITSIEPIRAGRARGWPSWRASSGRPASRSNTWTPAAASAFVRRRPRAVVRATTRPRSSTRPSDRLPIVIEPGRAIAGPAGALVARVIDLKPRTAERVRRPRRRHDRTDAAGAVRRVPSDRAGAPRGGAAGSTNWSARSAKAATSSAAIGCCRRCVGDLVAIRMPARTAR